MQIKRSQSVNITVPRNWTREQANAVIDFLEDAIAAIWDMHEQNIREVLRCAPTADELDTPDRIDDNHIEDDNLF